MNAWPYTQAVAADYKCAICGRPVGLSFIFNQMGQKIYYPASLYWNMLKSEVYCSPEHSLKGHT